MIEKIIELNFPSYATLDQATIVLNDMGDKTISTQVKIDGSIVPDFSYDWEIEFNGEKYIHPLRKPQGLKDNASICSKIDLVFYHWAIYQLKRDYFVELASTNAGTAFADNRVVPLSVNLGEFIIAFNNVLNYYFPDKSIYAVLNPDWQYDVEKIYIDINYSYLWDVLQKTYELFNVRWTIEKDDEGNYAIKFGYPAKELTHIFEYGFDGGLLKTERQVQNQDIRNVIYGRGGSQNLPYLYFKNYEKYPQGIVGDNQGMIPDPDAIPELRNIYFSELRSSIFRNYIQGWKTNPARELLEGDSLDTYDSERGTYDWAYQKGATDLQFAPVEYVKDDESIREYGALVGKIENNEEIFPSLQGMTIDAEDSEGNTFVTRADEVVAVSEVTTDKIDDEENSAITNDILLEAKSETEHNISIEDGTIAPSQIITVSSNEFEIPENYEGTLFDYPVISKYSIRFKDQVRAEVNAGGNIVSNKVYDHQGNLEIKQSDQAFPILTCKVIDVVNGIEMPSIVNIPPGKYRLDFIIDAPDVVFDLGQVHAENLGTNVIGRTFRLKFYWMKRLLTISATIVCKSFNGDVILNKIDGVAISETANVVKDATRTFSIVGDTFDVPEEGALLVDVPIVVNPAETTIYSEKTIKVINTQTNEIIPATNIPEGNYQLLVDVNIINKSSEDKSITVSLQPAYLYFIDKAEKWQPTFDIWIKNIFGTQLSDYSSEAAYVEGVWAPLYAEDDMTVTFTTGNLSGYNDWEFRVKKGGIAYDNNKVIIDANGNEVRSEWRLTLIKSDAELETIKKYIPYAGFNAKAGDYFFFTGINLPHQYILSAENELTQYIEDNLAEVKDIKPQWVVSLDKIRANQDGADNLIDTLSVGAVITLKDHRFTANVGERQILQSITYTWQNNVLLPNIDIVLSDKITTSLSSVALLQSEVQSLARAMGGLSNLEQIIRKIGDILYLRKDGMEDTSYSPTKFAETISSESFRPGAIGGNGWGVYQDSNHKSVFEVDKLFVRDEMHINNLITNQIAALGGTKILSAADITVSSVQTIVLEGDIVANRCYFETNGASRANLFAIDDIAYSNVFDSDNTELRYYKRRVIEVGDDYITLSTTDTDGTGTPQVGDVIVQLGNFTDVNRQSFILIDPLNGGKIEVYSGVNSYDLADCNKVGMGVNAETQEAFLYGYGDLFFGDRNFESDFITYQKKDGEDTRSLTINATVNFSSNSTGLSNLSDWKALEEEVGNKANASDLENFSNQVTTNIENLQDQIDGAITSWFYSGVPTLDNAPANEWLTDEDKNNHLGDLYYNEDSGKAYRFQLNSSTNTYEWKLILDEDITEALGLAQKAQDTADDKRRVFYETPTPPYDEGDLWSQGTTGDLMICTTAKAEGGSYVASDWGKASKYTDDTTANAVNQRITDDFDFLRDTFAKGETSISGGVVMTQMVAVGEGGDNIEAFLNGSDFAEDTDNHGKLILAAGIPEPSESGSDDLKDRAKEASTKIYEDGTIDTKNLIAKKGKISEFNFNEQELYVDLDETYESGTRTQKTVISPYRISITGTQTSTGEEGYRTQVSLYPMVVGGYYGSIATAGIIRHELQDAQDDTLLGYNTQCCALILSASGAIPLNERGLGGNYAILAESGAYAGLRPRTRTVTTNGILTTLDHTILVDSSSSIRLQLPEDPEVGQTYEIMMILPQNSSARMVTVYVPGSSTMRIHEPQADKWNLTENFLYAFGIMKLVCAEDSSKNKVWWMYRL